MLEIILLSFLAVEFEIALFRKFNFFEKFKDYAASKNSLFLYRLSNCEFCMHFHLSMLTSVLIIISSNLNFYYIITPVFVSGLKQFLDGIKT
jgi:hypothetical protein